MTRDFGIILTVGALGERYGGPSRTVTGLASALAGQGIKADIVFGHDDRIDGDIVRPSNPAVALHSAKVWQIKRFRYCPDFSYILRRRIKAASAGLVHDNGLWLPSNWAAWRTASALGVPYVLSPRGMVEPWALQWRAWRKRAALVLYQRRVLENTSLFFATSTQEYESLRRLGLRQPVAVIANGVDSELLEALPDMSKSKDEKRTRVVLFMSRIHPKKGIDNLLESWARINANGWILRLAGPDEDGYWSHIQQLARRLGLADCVEYLGPISSQKKRAVYGGADLFVLPSHSENFGVVVAEALAHSLPVITTKGTPWKGLEENGCGWWVDIGVLPLAKALSEAMGLSDEERSLMGRRGQEYVRRFSWQVIAEQTAEVYRWIFGYGDRPNWVHLD